MIIRTQSKIRNTSLDVLKGIAAIFVAFIHVQFAVLFELLKDKVNQSLGRAVHAG